MLAIRKQVHTILFAHRVARRAAHHAHPGLTGRATAGGAADRAARTAVVRVTVEIHALSSARGVSSEARERALTVIAAASRVGRRAANFSTSAAVVCVGVGVSAGAITIRGGSGTGFGARAFEAHFVRRTGPTALAAVEGIPLEIDAAP